MQVIDHFNLRSFDLNLLVAFDAMMEEMSVTRAAQRLKIQQPAMSHNISTLRTLFQDELFIRVGQVMKPTARALNLSGPVRQALRQAQAAVLMADVFDPATEQRTFRLGLSSEVELLLLPDLTARLRDIAPGIRILARGGDAAEVDASAGKSLDWPSQQQKLEVNVIATDIRDEPGEEWPLQELASRAAMSSRSFQRHFQSETGMSFRAWPQQAKLLKAVEWLAAGKSAGDIAFSLGYSGSSAFIAVFRAAFGTSPGQYFQGTPTGCRSGAATNSAD
ncbi:helix-turn-helix domain-containing protein [Sinorhizobium meliloti]|uniref:helix-turn-helix domain-containing protein n=1 Tax=Rhizobium meliloti TaxID=382 RepID=UPI001F177796|nr:helix-turn-helix domain-containing protein [Sinorhizobium meliloti]